MDITLTTPALVFPAVTFLLIAYTNRFLALGARIRNLHDRYRVNPDDVLLAQIEIMRRRVLLIRNMQACGVAAFSAVWFACSFFSRVGRLPARLFLWPVYYCCLPLWPSRFGKFSSPWRP